MSDLPADRVQPDRPPFSHDGVDCFGPFVVKRGRADVERYGIVYTCLTVRAIHIEVLHSMDTHSFINSFRRFAARRGLPELVRSDNGTNFAAGNRELREAIEEWNGQQINKFMIQRNIKWVFNPPSASHQGGVWERCVRSIRRILSSLTQEQKLGAFTGDEIYARRRWRQVQHLADTFWRRWTREYLPQLQQRQKWFHKKRNLAVGDIVLIVDDRCPRSSWPLGRIVETHTNLQDGCVRSAKVKTTSTTLSRPITKLVLLETVESTNS